MSINIGGSATNVQIQERTVNSSQNMSIDEISDRIRTIEVKIKAVIENIPTKERMEIEQILEENKGLCLDNKSLPKIKSNCQRMKDILEKIGISTAASTIAQFIKELVI